MTHPTLSSYIVIMEQWHPKKNVILPNNISVGSHQKAWWLCDKGHEWEAAINKRILGGQGCPFCNNKKIAVGFNDLMTTHPDIAKKWDYEKNEILPTEITAGSNKKTWWKCEHNHSSLAQVYRKVKNPNLCSVCRSRTVVEGINDLHSSHAHVLNIWNYEKNVLNPKNVVSGSHQKAWWLCDKGHEWEAAINKVTSGSTACPICGNKKVLFGFNDLGTTHSILLKEWNFELNEKKPEELTAGSAYLAEWICQQNSKHTWSAYVYSRTSKNPSGCPHCVATQTISKGEREIADFLKKWSINFDSSDRKTIKPLELDFYIPEKQIAIEFNGLYWHSEAVGKDKYYHYRKYKVCKDAGIQLIQIWEDDWVSNQEIILNKLKRVLGVTIETKIGARNTTVLTTVKKSVADEFLTHNHIQGSVSNSKFYALVDKEQKTVAMLGFRLEGATLNVTRYATSKIVQGGFSKLLKAAIADSTIKVNKIVTFSDNSFSDGMLYEKQGFIKQDKLIPPDYYYIKNNRKYHKSKFRLKAFKESEHLIYEENHSESQLAALNGLIKIWDAGKVKWVKYI